MVNIRNFSSPEDIPALNAAIDADQFHKCEWKTWHFLIPGVPTKVVEDDEGPVAFVLYTDDFRSGYMRVSCVWADVDPRRNARAMLSGVPQMTKVAHERGFNGIVIETKHYKLAKFLHRAFDATKIGDDYFVRFKETPCAALRAQ